MGKIESEKKIEKALAEEVKNLGGHCFKFLPQFVNGLPDRVCLLPGGKIFFVELKTTKQKARALQLLWHAKLRKLGFRVEVIDQTKQIKEILQDYAKRE